MAHGTVTGANGFILVANRLPVQQSDDGHEWRQGPGGLVTTLEPVARGERATWIGWSGARRKGAEAAAEGEPFEHDGMLLHPLSLTQYEITGYYEGLSNSTIWPLYHDMGLAAEYHRDWWAAYRLVNKRFAAITAGLAAVGATVWVQDYHLQLVPEMLRRLRPDLRIGFFLHIPMPSAGTFALLRDGPALLRGLIGADLLGFQTDEAADNFAQAAQAILGAKVGAGRVVVEDRSVRVGGFPASVDLDRIATAAATDEVMAKAAQIRRGLGDPATVILGVDRLDHSKGIEGRLVALRRLFADRSISVEDTCVVQVVAPSRTTLLTYRQLRQRLAATAADINREFGQPGRPAIHYIDRSVPQQDLLAYYRAADVLAATPLRDGMNLVAKEYVAARSDLGGALVLSELAGAASELREAFLVDPYNVDALAGALLDAIRPGQREHEERVRRMSAMHAHLRIHDVTRWAATFLRSLAG